jgi:tetratricopeptide (TPR) repeat protein
MEHRVRKDINLINLVTDFESKFELGLVEYIDEKTIHQLLEYYESEMIIDKAIEVIDIACEQYPYRYDYLLAKGRLLLADDRPKDCLKTLEKASILSPGELEINYIKIKAYCASKQLKAAKELLAICKLTSDEDDIVSILIAEAYIYETERNYEGMYISLKKALRRDNSNQEALSKFWDAVDYARKYDDSIVFHKSLIDEQPYNHLAWYNLGLSYSYSQEYAKAIDALEYSFIINPEFEAGYLECAEICIQQSSFLKALDIYQDVVSKFGVDSDILVSMASCFVKLGRIEQAKSKLQKALKLDPYNDEVFYYLGICYAAKNNWYNAINALYKAVELDNAREEYYLELAKAYAKVEDYNKATINYHKAATLASEDVHYWKEYICFVIKLGLYDEALELLDEAEYNTFGAELLYCRAITLFFKKQKRDGLDVLAEALEEDFEKYSIIYTLAPELEIDKDINAMIRYYEREYQEWL